jgi:hypothetical protein
MPDSGLWSYFSPRFHHMRPYEAYTELLGLFGMSSTGKALGRLYRLSMAS